jgi:uncharacterized protein
LSIALFSVHQGGKGYSHRCAETSVSLSRAVSIGMKRTLTLCSILLGLLSSCATSGEVKTESGSEFNPLLSIVQFYRGPLNHLAAVKQGECPMNPSCSEYSVQCLQKHGFFMGWMMTCDRLMRCGRDELRLSPQIVINGKPKCHDPVENNDFWWHER